MISCEIEGQGSRVSLASLPIVYGFRGENSNLYRIIIFLWILGLIYSHLHKQLLIQWNLPYNIIMKVVGKSWQKCSECFFMLQILLTCTEWVFNFTKYSVST